MPYKMTVGSAQAKKEKPKPPTIEELWAKIQELEKRIAALESGKTTGG